MERLKGIPGIQISEDQEHVKRNYAYFPVIFNENLFRATRDDIYRALDKHSIHARKYFYPLTNSFDCYHGVFDANKTPTALYVSKHVLTLPLYPELELTDVDRICDIILGCRESLS